MKNLKYLLAVVSLVFLLAPAVSAKDYLVTVLDKDENPIRNANVELINLFNEAVCKASTNREGSVNCRNILPGEDYTLKVTHSDYDSINNDRRLRGLSKNTDDILVVVRPKEDYDMTVRLIDEWGRRIEDAKITVKSLERDYYRWDYDESYDIVVFPDKNTKYPAFEFIKTRYTDGNGRVVFRDLEFNTRYELTISKTGYKEIQRDVRFLNKPMDYELEAQLIKRGTGSFTARLLDQNRKAVSGITVTLRSQSTGESWSGNTNSAGETRLLVGTPGFLDIHLNCPGYSCKQPSSIYLANNQAQTLTIYVSTLNNPPIANAGIDFYVMVGDNVWLNAGDSYDPDGDALTYTWEDSRGGVIPAGVSPKVSFTSPGEHTITLTVKDGGGLTAKDTAQVTVETPENCGDDVCSVTEKLLRNCPRDCPVCLDAVCGSQEDDTQSGSYCPKDCGIQVSLVPAQTSGLLVGDKVTLEFKDPKTGRFVKTGVLEVTLPSGETVTKKVITGSSDIQITQPGQYNLLGITSRYSDGSITLTASNPEKVISEEVNELTQQIERLSKDLEIIQLIIIAVLLAAIILLIARLMITQKKRDEK